MVFELLFGDSALLEIIVHGQGREFESPFWLVLLSSRSFYVAIKCVAWSLDSFGLSGCLVCLAKRLVPFDLERRSGNMKDILESQYPYLTLKGV